MLKCEEFFNVLKENDIEFFAGVPDSLLKDFCAYIADNVEKRKNVIAANEGNAVALVTGHHLATKKIGVVYMQNSGLGNVVNPIASLADPLVYSIPMLLLVGWRGEPGVKDEPQHVKQGEITLETLDVLGVKHCILPGNLGDAKAVLKEAIEYIKLNNCPYAIIISKGTFEEYKLKNIVTTNYELNREEAIKILASNLSPKDVVISTTGMTSRELFEYREHRGESHEKDFLTVGSMGHASQISMGIALSKPNKDVYCIDGDGAVIMHMGALAIIGNSSLANFKHIVINNGAHDSVGGQPTVGFNIDICAIAKACGYKNTYCVHTREEMEKYVKQIKIQSGPVLMEIKVNKGHRKNLGRPTISPIDNKMNFMKFLNQYTE